MSHSSSPALAFDASALPDNLPVFPLQNVVLLPRARLPLHIFEPRYLDMVQDALASRDRLIGMIQPMVETDNDKELPPLYSIGCAGRITSFAEIEGGRMMISLTGVCRFGVMTELDIRTPYRRVRPNWDEFLTDLTASAEVDVNRERLFAALKPFFKSQNLEADWEAVRGMEDEMLISTLVMICPFAPNEKQALLEARDLASRHDMLMALLEMSALPSSEAASKH